MATKRQTFSQMLDGVDDVYLTKKSIALERVSTIRDSFGQLVCTTTRKYVPKTRKTMGILKQKMGYVREGK